jgi:hypothetical protein
MAGAGTGVLLRDFCNFEVYYRNGNGDFILEGAGFQTSEGFLDKVVVS